MRVWYSWRHIYHVITCVSKCDFLKGRLMVTSSIIHLKWWIFHSHIFWRCEWLEPDFLLLFSFCFSFSLLSLVFMRWKALKAGEIRGKSYSLQGITSLITVKYLMVACLTEGGKKGDKLKIKSEDFGETWVRFVLVIQVFYSEAPSMIKTYFLYDL